MTTYRRFCCNDLLRFGSLNLKSHTPTQSMRIYMNHLAMWPENFHVADVPGGRIVGYIFAEVAGKDHYCTGKLSALVLASTNMLDLGKKLSKLLEDCCEKIYNACSMQMIIPANDSVAVATFSKLGYQMYKQHEGMSEMRKLLPRFAMMMPGEEIEDELMKLFDSLCDHSSR